MDLIIQILFKIMSNQFNVIHKILNLVDINVHLKEPSRMVLRCELHSKHSTLIFRVKCEDLALLAFNLLENSNSSVLSVLHIYNLRRILYQVLWELVILFLNSDKECIMSLLPFYSKVQKFLICSGHLTSNRKSANWVQLERGRPIVVRNLGLIIYWSELEFL